MPLYQGRLYVSLYIGFAAKNRNKDTDSSIFISNNYLYTINNLAHLSTTTYKSSTGTMYKIQKFQLKNYNLNN